MPPGRRVENGIIAEGYRTASEGISETERDLRLSNVEDPTAGDVDVIDGADGEVRS